MERLPPRIAFFGGTFDPIHEGHLEIAEKALSILKLDQVIFIPCRRSPHKTNGPKVSDQDRFEMLNLATASLPWAQIEDYELKKAPPSYTSETVAYFKEKHPPQTQHFLLIGFDQWEALPRWKNPEFLTQNVEFIVVGRNQQASPRDGYTAHFIEGNHPASSSQIRKDLAATNPPQWLPESVRAYIHDKGLYFETR